MPRLASRPVHPADRAVQAGDPADPEAATVLRAFAAYEAGDDAAARAAVQPIGLASPYLPWKLLLRGLIAYAAGDDALAVENWKRLPPDRLPAKLAAPVWATLEPDRADTPAVRRAVGKLTGGPLAERLTKLGPLLARGRPLKGAFAAAELALPSLRRQAPHLVPRLAGLFYRAVRDHGERADLPRLRELFGPPADDPDFHRLEALAFEDSRRPQDAAAHWLRYEGWLATAPPGWPAGVRDRARAVVLHRAAGLARRTEVPDLLRRATELAPDWDAPALALADKLQAVGRDAEAEAAVRGLLLRRPDHPPALDALAGLLDKVDRPLDLLEVRRRALALNPLDPARRAAVAGAAVRAGRALVAVGDPAGAVATLAANRDVADDGPAGFRVLWRLLHRKLGRPPAADLPPEAESGDDRLAVALLLAVDAGLLKLKPADKKPLTDALAAALDGPATPAEVLHLLAAFDGLKADRVSYRGQVGHNAKIEALALTAGPGDARGYEGLADYAARSGRWKLVGKLLPGLRRRFPHSPVFPLLEVEAEVQKTADRGLPLRAAGSLREARRLAEASTDGRHRALLDRIGELERRAGPFDLLRSLFDEV